MAAKQVIMKRTTTKRTRAKKKGQKRCPTCGKYMK